MPKRHDKKCRQESSGRARKHMHARHRPAHPAPTHRSSGSSRQQVRTLIVGNAETPNRVAVAVATVASTATSFTSPASCSAADAHSGARCLQ